MRIAKVNRKTKETSIEAEINLDGTGIYKIDTGIGFLNHMLEQLSKHSLVDINLKAKGDLHIDLHHTTEDSVTSAAHRAPERREIGRAQPPVNPAGEHGCGQRPHHPPRRRRQHQDTGGGAHHAGQDHEKGAQTDQHPVRDRSPRDAFGSPQRAKLTLELSTRQQNACQEGPDEHQYCPAPAEGPDQQDHRREFHQQVEGRNACRGTQQGSHHEVETTCDPAWFLIPVHGFTIPRLPTPPRGSVRGGGSRWCRRVGVIGVGGSIRRCRWGVFGSASRRV